MIDLLKQHSKAVAPFLIVVITGGIANGLIVGAAAGWATVIIGALGTLGTYVAPANKPPAT